MNDKKHKAAIRYGLYALMGILGVSITILAPMLEVILKEYRLSLSLGGTFTGLMSFGGIITILLLSLFSDRMSKSKIVIVGGFAFSVSLVLICFAPNYSFLLLFFVAAGIGSRTVDVMSNAVLADMYVGESGMYMNLMHMYLGVGAIAGPIVSGSLLERGISWKLIFGGLGFLYAVVSIVFAWILFGGRKKTFSENEKKSRESHNSVKTWIKDRRVWFLCLVCFLYTGHQNCINIWISLYYQEQFAFEEGMAGLALSMYWIGIAISRFLCSRFYRPDNARKLLLWGGVMGTAVLGAGILSGGPYILFVALLLCGVFTGGVIPVTIDMACGIYPSMSGSISSAIAICMNISPFLFPNLMGVAGDRYGMVVGISFAVLSLALMSISALWIEENHTVKVNA